jgi:LacI family transcriptional regulator
VRRATIEEVAEAAGVSTATVSRFLAGTGRVSEPLAARVRSAVTALDYVPNVAARALSMLRSGEVGIVVSNLENDAPVAAAAMERLAAAGLVALLARGAVPESADRAAREFADRAVEAVLFIGAPPSAAAKAMLEGRAIALTVVAEGVPGAVAVDIAGAAGYLSHRLAALGHARIALLGPAASPWLHALEDELRRSAFHLRMAPPAAVVGLLQGRDRPTAIVCADDLVAAAAVQACHGLHVDVPGEVSVIGWGDRPFAACLRPSLTTVRLPLEAMGEKSADCLLAVRAGQAAPESRLPGKLVVRRSLSAACST